jgi:hypothetical protein
MQDKCLYEEDILAHTLWQMMHQIFQSYFRNYTESYFRMWGVEKTEIDTSDQDH